MPLISYKIGGRIEVRQTDVYETWLRRLKDRRARSRIVTRTARIEDGLLGDAKALGGGLHGLRVPHGPGYRIYFTRRGAIVVLLLCGGDKSTET